MCVRSYNSPKYLYTVTVFSPHLLTFASFKTSDQPTISPTQHPPTRPIRIYQKPTHCHWLPSHIVRNKKNPVKRPELINCRICALNPELFVAANSCTAGEGIAGVSPIDSFGSEGFHSFKGQRSDSSAYFQRHSKEAKCPQIQTSSLECLAIAKALT